MHHYKSINESNLMETKIAIGSFADFSPLIYEFVKCSEPIEG